ncbi:DUF3019 domain-containing protein [Aliikangiella sp. IMCC44359]|uniref:DUF3019 domain-containing protein n=1 Tax=Aliikangiella sp. IMCC44359 TaxID=3459125 RepID=UPI00403B1469
MYFKGIITSLLIYFTGFATYTLAEKSTLLPISLDLLPNKCVALRKGRECFAKINVRWHAQVSGNYCLRRQADKLIINCWKNQMQGDFSYIFRSQNAEILELIFENSDNVIITAPIKVSWVYKSKKRKGRWRVF